MKNRDRLEREHSFWIGFSAIHLYSTKGEAVFKAFAIGVSWIGGIFVHTTVGVDAFYLFSIAIIMEYIVQLLKYNDFLPKLLPGLLVVLNIIILFFSTAGLFGKTFSSSVYQVQWYATAMSLVIIVIDAFLMVFVKVPLSVVPVESNLKNLAL